MHAIERFHPHVYWNKKDQSFYKIKKGLNPTGLVWGTNLMGNVKSGYFSMTDELPSDEGASR